MHKIAVVAPLNLVESKLVGAFTRQAIVTYEGALLAHFQQGRLVSGYRMLIDLSEALVQRQDIIVALFEHVARMPKASRIAVVTGDAAIRQQARRVLQQPYLKHFDDRLAGLTWLMERAPVPYPS